MIVPLYNEIHCLMQIQLSTKSSLKELAASVNKHLKVKNQVAKDEL